MALLDFFLSRKKNTANIAKERLQIIVAERRRGDAEPHYLPQLRKDILEVICKYVQIDPEMVSVQLEQRDGDISKRKSRNPNLLFHPEKKPATPCATGFLMA